MKSFSSLGKWIPIHGKLYHFSQERIKFGKAKATCEHNFGKLFEPKDKTINNDIAVRARDLGIINPWIGIHHLHDEERTVFASDNTIVSWSNWDPNEPNNENDREDCAHLYNLATLDLKRCYHTHDYVNDGYCDDFNNREDCAWDGGDCCGDNVKTEVFEYDGTTTPTCSACECLQPFRWNDNTCEEYRRFICEKEVTG